MKHLLVIAASLMIVACQDARAPQVKSAVTSRASGPVIPEVREGFEGYYTGAFDPEDNNGESNRISVRLDSVSGTNIYGESIVAGNQRPFKGTWNRLGNTISMALREPGSDKYDGEFTAELNGDTLSGGWQSYDKKIPVPARLYKLSKRVFIYDPALQLSEAVREAYTYASYNEKKDGGERTSEAILTLNASVRDLRSKDVENLYRSDLELLRNAIYARHGYSFKNVRMRAVFNNVAWYMPVSTNVTEQLTPREQKNIALLKRYEAHATTYYDSFGR
jgi:hypothetical protein